MTDFDVAVAAAIDVSRPRTSGPSVNVHVVQSPKVTTPDYERMKQQIQGPDKQEVDKQ